MLGRPVHWMLGLAMANAAIGVSRPPWIADLGDGRYRNPVLHADYSDPDVVRVGVDFWLTSSSVNQVPALPILHSRDLVNWTIVNHALPRLVPGQHFAVPRHGGGVWAPSIRHHDGRYWIYYPDPDFGIHVITATDPAGRWSRPTLVKAGKGLIDPCPLWDDDGRVYLVHAWARSRSGRNNILTLTRLSGDGLRALDEGHTIVDGDRIAGMHTLEGPKLYKLDGWYYVFAPSGGVTAGVQSVFRSRSIEGPYEHRVVLAQGATAINGPHQGALVDTPEGRWWFVHFQDKGAYGRVVHLQPVSWRGGWPIIGAGSGPTGAGEPVTTYEKPRNGERIAVPQSSDEFDGEALGLQWQWQANPRSSWMSLDARRGYLGLFAVPLSSPATLYDAANLLLQKFPAPVFTATASVSLAAADGDAAGLIVFGDDYAWVGLRRSASGTRLVQAVNIGAAKGAAEQELASTPVGAASVILRAAVSEGAVCRFSSSADGITFVEVGREFRAAPGRWVGAKVGVFASAPPGSRASGHADVDWFRVEAAR